MEDFFSVYKNRIMLLFGLIIFILTLTFIRSVTNKNAKDKIVTNKEYIVTIKELSTKNNLKSEIPFINIKINNIDNINNEISKFIYNETIVFNRSVSYEYYVQKNEILSLLITSKEYLTTNELALVKYKSYNIDLKSKKLLTNEELLQKYDLLQEDFDDLYTREMKQFYKDALVEEFTDGYCDFEAYVKYHELDDGQESYFVNNNEIYYYKDFLFSSILGDEEFFSNRYFEINLPINQK